MVGQKPKYKTKAKGWDLNNKNIIKFWILNFTTTKMRGERIYNGAQLLPLRPRYKTDSCFFSSGGVEIIANSNGNVTFKVS